jgi:hypothetical protein
MPFNAGISRNTTPVYDRSNIGVSFLDLVFRWSLRMASVTRAAARLETYRVEGKAELIAGTIVHLANNILRHRALPLRLPKRGTAHIDTGFSR